MQVIDFVNTFSIVGIVGTPSPPLLKRGGGVGPSKNWVTGGVPKILLERGDNPEKEGVDKEMGGRGGAVFLLLYSSTALAECGE